MALNNLECRSCSQSFGRSADNFIRHMENAHASDMIECTNCTYRFESGFAYATHFVDAHLGVADDCSFDPFSETSAELDCPMCAFSAPDEVAISDHFDAVHAVGEPSETDSHQQTATSYNVSQENLLQCPVCHLTFDTSDSINAHVNSHFNGKKFCLK